MKYLSLFIIMMLVLSCTTTQLVDHWKNPHIDTYEPSKVLVVGLTSNIEAREKFENQLKTELTFRNIDAVMSLDLFDPSFRTKKMTENEIKGLETNLINDGFDTVLFSKIIGVEDKIAYKNNYDGFDETYTKFKDDYLMYQDVFYNPEYYNEYTVYHAETSMYCICPSKDRELIWKGYVDIVDPESIDDTVNDYIRLIMVVLEEQQLINPKKIEEDQNTETLQSVN